MSAKTVVTLFRGITYSFYREGGLIGSLVLYSAVRAVPDTELLNRITATFPQWISLEPLQG